MPHLNINEMLISSYINNNSQKETINMNGFRTALTVTTLCNNTGIPI